MGKHSPCDALVPSIVAEYVIGQGIENEVSDPPNADGAFLDVTDRPKQAGEVTRKEEGWENL